MLHSHRVDTRIPPGGPF